MAEKQEQLELDVDVEVEIEEDEEETKVEASQTNDDDDSLEGYGKKVRDRIERMTYKLRETERRERAATEYAQALQKTNEELTERTKKVDESYIKEYDTRVLGEEETLKRRLQDAINNGDVDGQVDAQKGLARLAIESERLSVVKAENENRIRAADEAKKNPPVQQRAAPDPRAERWASKNIWFGSDEPMTLTAFSIHKKLVENEGYSPNSEEYYGEIDSRMRKEFPHKFEKMEDTRTQRAPVAGVSRSNGTSSKGKIKLSKSQVAIANKLGVSYEAYAKQLMNLQQREG
jgi:hypothetical protein